MRNNNRGLQSLIIVIAIITLSGCAKKVDPIDKSLVSAKPPKWVIKGNGAFNNQMGRIFYGVGSASGFQNFSLQRTTAENRARNDIARLFKFYTSSLMKDYEVSTGAGKDINNERHITQAIKTVTAETLSGVIIIDHWEHPARGEIFALARLDLQKFKENFSKLKPLSNEVKEYVDKNADIVHEELKAE